MVGPEALKSDKQHPLWAPETNVHCSLAAIEKQSFYSLVQFLTINLISKTEPQIQSILSATFYLWITHRLQQCVDLTTNEVHVSPRLQLSTLGAEQY